jgi:RHS repeat-associated protein
LSNHLFWQADSYAVNGAVESHTLGNGLVCDRVISPVTGRLRAIAAGIRGGTHAQYHTYGYDLLGQIIRRQDLTLGREETFAYDGLNRLTHYKAGPPFIMPDLNGMDSPPLLPFSKTVTQSYDALGNITAKSDFGTYSYGGAAGPHAVASVYDAATGATRDYTYDANGNMLSDADRGMEWTVFDQVEKITRGATWTKFHFGASRERIMQEHSDGAKTIYVGSLYEAVSGPDGFLEEKYHVYSPSGRVATRTVRSDALVETRYYHSDGIGSITAVSDEYGRIEKRFAFDPWGRRDLLLDFHTGEGGKVTRGFTDHEHLDDFGLIHMNGRVFDPVLGRFLSADPYVGDAGSSQAYNRYSYCDNNPLNSTDPSGYFKIDIESIVIVGIAIGVSYCTYGAASTVMYAWAAAALAGATGGFTGAYMSALSAGASDNAALKAGLKAGLIGAAVAAVSSGIGSYFDMKWGIWSNDYANWTGRTLAHAVVGGVSSEMDGGQFRHGFYSSALSNGVMHMGGVKGFMGGNQGGWYVAARTTIAALIGGTAAELSGGKFANGAWTSALQHLFNKEAHIDENKNDTKVDLAFYDNSLESRPITDGSREDFKAAAEARGKTAIPVESSGDIVSYFKNNPGKYLDIGFFGHGNSDGIYINGKLVSKRVIISMISGLQPKGELYLFACNVADAIGMNPPRIDSYSEYLNDGKVIWAHKGIINHVKWTITSPKGKVTIERHMRSDGYENLYMRKYIK